MLADALLRQGRGDLAGGSRCGARPLARGHRIEAPVHGRGAARRQAEGLQALDELLEQRTDDEPSLALGLLVLYEAFGAAEPIESVDRDRARMLRLAEIYKRQDGPSQALVDAWVAAVAAKK